MTGLEKILSQIEKESDDRCQELQDNAEKKAKEIIADAEGQAQELLNERKAQADKKAQTVDRSAQSSKELEKSRILLAARLESIDEVLEKALEVIKALPKREYFDILKELIVKNAGNGEGTLRLSKADSARLPANFVEGVNNALKKGSSVKLGDCADIDSGFVLTYGEVDINCSFDAIAASKREELRDALNSLLFK